GEVLEWPSRAACEAVARAKPVPGVRIPPSPLFLFVFSIDYRKIEESVPRFKWTHACGNLAAGHTFFHAGHHSTVLKTMLQHFGNVGSFAKRWKVPTPEISFRSRLSSWRCKTNENEDD